MKLTTLDLFAGIGGFARGLEATDFFETSCFVENEPYCQAVLRHHWPEVPILGDIRDVKGSDLPTRPDVICGGFPCQPFSHAGKQLAQADPRHLWPEMFRLIRECRPTWVIGENVTGLVRLGLDEVLSSLAAEGYATRTFNIPACAVGAPHIRQRLWVVAHSDSESEPDKPFDGGAGSGQLGFQFGRSEASSHGSDADESGSYRAGEHEQDAKHGQAQLRDKQVCEPGQVGQDVADAASIDGQRSIGQGGCTRESEAAFGDGGGVVADTAGNGRRQGNENSGGCGEGSGEEQGTRLRGGGEVVANPQSIITAGLSRESNQEPDRGNTRLEPKRRSNGQSGRESESTLAGTKRPGTGVEESRDSGQGRESADTRQFEVWWEVEPPVGRVVDGLPNRVSQLRALGNSIVPQIARKIGEAIKETYNADRKDS